jgi:hypothetical protein
MAHHTGKIALRSPQAHMVVVAHETVRKDFNSPKLMDLSQGVEKYFIVSLVQEGLLPGASPVHDMIERGGKLNAQGTRH